MLCYFWLWPANGEYKLFPKINFILGNNAVESEGFEPSSKHTIKKCSTSLVFVKF